MKTAYVPPTVAGYGRVRAICSHGLGMVDGKSWTILRRGRALGMPVEPKSMLALKLSGRLGCVIPASTVSSDFSVSFTNMFNEPRDIDAEFCLFFSFVKTPVGPKVMGFDLLILPKWDKSPAFNGTREGALPAPDQPSGLTYTCSPRSPPHLEPPRDMFSVCW